MAVSYVKQTYNNTVNSVKKATQQVVKDTKVAWKNEVNVVKSSAKQAAKDTYGVGAAVGAGVGARDAKLTGQKITGALKGAAKASGVEFLVRFSGNLIDNQLKLNNNLRYNHGVK